MPGKQTVSKSSGASGPQSQAKNKPPSLPPAVSSPPQPRPPAEKTRTHATEIQKNVNKAPTTDRTIQKSPDSLLSLEEMGQDMLDLNRVDRPKAGQMQTQQPHGAPEEGLSGSLGAWEARGAPEGVSRG